LLGTKEGRQKGRASLTDRIISYLFNSSFPFFTLTSIDLPVFSGVSLFGRVSLSVGGVENRVEFRTLLSFRLIDLVWVAVCAVFISVFVFSPVAASGEKIAGRGGERLD